MSLEKNLRVNKLLDQYGSLLSKKQLSVMHDYYRSDLGLSEIADSCNITRQAVLDIVKRCESKLIKFEQALNFVKKKQELLDAVSKPNICLEQIKKLIGEL